MILRPSQNILRLSCTGATKPFGLKLHLLAMFSGCNWASGNATWLAASVRRPLT